MNAKRSMAKVSDGVSPPRLVAASLVLCTALVLLYWGIGLGGTNEDGALETARTSARLGGLPNPPISALATGLPPDAAAAERYRQAALLEALTNASKRYIEFSNATSRGIIDLHLETAFSAQALSSLQTLTESFQKISRLQSLQQVAAQSKADYVTEVQTAIKNSGLGAPATDQKIADLELGLLATVQLEREIQGLENQTTRAAVAILEFARAELGKSTLVGGQLVFQSPEKNQQLQLLMAELVRSSREQNKASVRFSELQQKQKYALDRILAK